MKYRNHQYITKIFHVLEVGNYSRILHIFNGGTKDKCADMDVFVNESTRSTWTKLFGEFGSLQEHELRGNSLHIQNHTEIDFWSFFERFCLWIRFTALLHPGRDRYCLMIKWSSRLKQRYLSALIPYCDCWKWMRADVLLKDWKVKWKKSRCPLLTKNRQESMENKLNSSWRFPRIYIIADSTRDSEYLQERNIKSQEFTDRITFMSMFNDIDWRGKTIRFREVKTHAKKFLQGHWTFFCLGDDKRLYGKSKYPLEEESDSVSGGTATRGNR